MNMLSKIGEFVKEFKAEIILGIGVILISLLSFLIGYIVAKSDFKEQVKVEMPDNK